MAKKDGCCSSGTCKSSTTLTRNNESNESSSLSIVDHDHSHDHSHSYGHSHHSHDYEHIQEKKEEEHSNKNKEKKNGSGGGCCSSGNCSKKKDKKTMGGLGVNLTKIDEKKVEEVEQVDMLDKAILEKTNPSASSKSSCCKSGVCSKRSNNEPKVMMVVEEEADPKVEKNVSSCCNSGKCSKKTELKMEEKVEQKASSCCSSGKCSKKTEPKVEEKVEQKASSCCSSGECSKKTEPKVEEKVEQKASSCCSSGKCSKKTEPKMEEKVEQKASSCCSSGKCSKKMEPKVEEKVEQKASSCCSSDKCSKKTMTKTEQNPTTNKETKSLADTTMTSQPKSMQTWTRQPRGEGDEISCCSSVGSCSMTRSRTLSFSDQLFQSLTNGGNESEYETGSEYGFGGHGGCGSTSGSFCGGGGGNGNCVGSVSSGHYHDAHPEIIETSPRPDHGVPDCVAILREDGHVDVYDVRGQVKTFTPMDDFDAKGNGNGMNMHDPSSKVCFSSHGNDEMDRFLTHCFDHEGMHGDPEEKCFCGVDGPHLHAHLRSAANCTHNNSGKNGGTSSKADIHTLANITLYPVEFMDSPPKLEPDQETYPMPASARLPSACNSKEFTKSLVELGNGVAEEYDASKQSILKIQHDDHYDTLVHNEKTGKITLEHDCEDCGDTDVHGALEFVSKRSFHTAANDRNIQMNFYEVAKTPLQLLDVLADFFALETDKSHIIRSAFNCSPSNNRGKKPCCKDGVCSNLNDRASIIHSGTGSGSHGIVRSTIHVKQICCAAEIPMINSIIKPLRGVSNVSVSTTTKLVHLSHDPEVTTAEEVVQALNREKFGATLRKDGGLVRKEISAMTVGSTSGKSSFFVSGICCAAEIPAINSILEPLKGVQKVTINVPNKTVYVEHEFASITAKDIKDALDREKFDSRIEKDAGAVERAALPSTIMTKYVESTFRVDSFLGQDDGTKIKTVLRDQFSREDLSHVEVHIPSKTVKVDHNPQLVSAQTLIDFTKKSGLELSLIADGFKEGIWTAGDDEDHVEEEHTKLQWHIIFSGLFWIVSMLHFIGGNWDYLKYTGIISVVLGIPKIAMKAFMTLKRRQFDTNCMMLFATLGALALQEFSEAAAVTFLFSISDWLETLSTARARNALSAIVRLRPERAKIKDPISGKFVFAPASSVSVGSIVSVRTGDKIPCDGIVVEGSSVVDESSLTGESRPVQKGSGSIVSGGTVNAGVGQLLIETTSTSDNSAVARLIRLVEDAQANRSPTEKMIDEFAKRYTPVVVLLAISMCTFPWIAGNETGREWTKIGLVTIVIACPCALIISTPVTYVAGLASAAQRGIVVKGGAHLETLGRVKKIAFDKTGTLTEGNFKLLHLRTWGAKSRAEALQYLYCIEADASHPLAAAIVSAAKAENISAPLSWTIENHQNLEGEGVTASINSQTVHVGNFRLFERLNYIKDLSDGELQLVKRWMDDGGTVGFLGIEGHGIVASYCVADAVREEARHVIASFNKLGIDTNMLTGDNAKAANSIGRGLGLTERQIKSQLLPSEKLDLVKEFIQEENNASTDKSCLQRRRPGLVLMCGDGVNDAPALAIADVGVAMGAGAALAMETADVTLLDSNLLKLLKVVKLGRRVTRTIMENVIFSFVAKAVVMGFTFAGYSSLWAAIGSDVGSMLIVTANGMKLLPSKKSVRAGTGFDSFEVRGSTKAGSTNANASFPIGVEATGEEKLLLTHDL